MRDVLSAWRIPDSVLAIALAIIATFSLVGLASLGLRSDPSDLSIFWRQAIAMGISGIAVVTVARLDWRAWERWWPIVAIGVGVLLVGVLFIGARIRGTRGWFALGPVTFQPVECAKIGLILLQAVYFRRRAHDLHRFRTVLESAAITTAIVVPVLLQPDLGSALLIIGTWLGMLAVFGLQRAHLLAIVGTGIVAAVVGWVVFLQPYQRERIRTFLDPHRDPQGAGYNQRQAVIAIGAGEWWGRGFGQGSQAQLRFLPEAPSDFLLAVIGEEFGFVGIGLILAALGVALDRLGAIARRCSDDGAAAVVVGYGMLLGIQAAANAGMNLGIAPVMGIPFPFLSAGGSSVVTLGLGLGLVLGIAARAPRAERQSYAREVESVA